MLVVVAGGLFGVYIQRSNAAGFCLFLDIICVDYLI